MKTEIKLREQSSNLTAMINYFKLELKDAGITIEDRAEADGSVYDNFFIYQAKYTTSGGTTLRRDVEFKESEKDPQLYPAEDGVAVYDWDTLQEFITEMWNEAHEAEAIHENRESMFDYDEE